MKALIVAAAIVTALAGCAGPGSSRPVLSSKAYRSATPENQARIEAGKCGTGMTIAECRAAWPDKNITFVHGYTSGEKNRYETWKVENYSSQKGPMIWFFLHTKDGAVIDISEFKKGASEAK